MAKPKSEALDDQAGKILELCGEHALDRPLLEQIKPCKSLAGQLTALDKTLAQYLVKEEATLAHKRNSPVLRVLTKPPLPDSNIVTTTIVRHIKQCRHDNSGHVLEALLGTLATVVTPAKLNEVVNELLLKAVRRNSSSYVSPLAARASHETLDTALREALLRQRAHCVKCLLSHGADPNSLGVSHLSKLMIDNVKVFELLLRAHHPLKDENFGPLCTAAAQSCSTRTFNLLLRAKYRTGSQKAAGWDRDNLLKELLRARKFDMFYVLASTTFNWPLTTGTVFLDAIESTKGLHSTREKVIEILLCLTKDFNAVASAYLVQLFSSLISENDSEMMSIFLKHSHIVPSETIGLICRLGALDLLDIVLSVEYVGQTNPEINSRISVDASHILDLIRAVLDEPQPLCTDVVKQLIYRVGLFLSSQSTDSVPSPGFYEILTSAMQSKMQNSLELRIMSILEVTQDIKLQYRQNFALGQPQLDKLLLCAVQNGLALLAEALLESGASPDISDTKGRSALFLAVLGGHEKIVRVLVDGQAPPNDGSLHVAACKEQWGTMQILLMAGHSPLRRCAISGWTTVLEACVRHAYSPWPLILDNGDDLSYPQQFPSQDFPTTIAILMHEEQSKSNIARKATEIVLVLVLALTKQHTHALVSELLSYIEKYTVQSLLSPQRIYRNGSLRFSVLGLIERWPKVALDPDDQQDLVERMRSEGFQPVFYTVEGDQPPYAVCVPEALVEAQKRRTAFNSKECSVQVYCAQPGLEDIHAGLVPACNTTHGWDDTIICTDCLQSYLEARMFPLEDQKSVADMNFVRGATETGRKATERSAHTSDTSDDRHCIDKLYTL
ncbi:hypothetical protein H2198_010353 [Neophaeococcomyces mojaviensis]|uniref:Uncharacterized protein n=1 Tax=Neophaeococcomyces mojaviensis TaxID=3383035 RepID=A0ACC2ZRY3_9EURO|nr:hypothetical protein H2198_010353 [Knufia sp. JES_112]